MISDATIKWVCFFVENQENSFQVPQPCKCLQEIFLLVLGNISTRHWQELAGIFEVSQLAV